MKNLLREKIMNGEKTVGTFFEAGNASVAEALALTDLDYMFASGPAFRCVLRTSARRYSDRSVSGGSSRLFPE